MGGFLVFVALMFIDVRGLLENLYYQYEDGRLRAEVPSRQPASDVPCHVIPDDRLRMMALCPQATSSLDLARWAYSQCAKLGRHPCVVMIWATEKGAPITRDPLDIAISCRLVTYHHNHPDRILVRNNRTCIEIKRAEPGGVKHTR